MRSTPYRSIARVDLVDWRSAPGSSFGTGILLGILLTIAFGFYKGVF